MDSTTMSFVDSALNNLVEDCVVDVNDNFSTAKIRDLSENDIQHHSLVMRICLGVLVKGLASDIDDPRPLHKIAKVVIDFNNNSNLLQETSFKHLKDFLCLGSGSSDIESMEFIYKIDDILRATAIYPENYLQSRLEFNDGKPFDVSKAGFCHTRYLEDFSKSLGPFPRMYDLLKVSPKLKSGLYKFVQIDLRHYNMVETHPMDSWASTLVIRVEKHECAGFNMPEGMDQTGCLMNDNYKVQCVSCGLWLKPDMSLKILRSYFIGGMTLPDWKSEILTSNTKDVNLDEDLKKLNMKSNILKNDGLMYSQRPRYNSPEVEDGTEIRANPFSDSGRVTASGFTDNESISKLETENEYLKSQIANARSTYDSTIMSLEDQLRDIRHASERYPVTMSTILEDPYWNDKFSMRDAQNFADKYKKNSKQVNDNASTICPNDSVTAVGCAVDSVRYKRVSEKEETENAKKLMGGFLLTKDEASEARDKFDQMRTICGLEPIFQDTRLDFYFYLHNSLKIYFSESNGRYPCRNPVRQLNTLFKAVDTKPQTQLLREVVKVTFDLQRGLVLNNPFNLPNIEPGMMIDDLRLYIALDQMHREFEMLWHRSMRGGSMPGFADKYSRRDSKSSHDTSDSRDSGSSRRSTGSDRKSRRSSPKSDIGVGSIIGSLISSQPGRSDRRFVRD